MRLFFTIIVAMRALHRNKMRSTLTALGIIIGVGAVIAMVSIGNGAKSQVEAQVASFGQNLIIVFAGSATSGGAHGGWGGAGTLTIEDANAIKTEVRDVEAVSPEVRTSAQALANGFNWGTNCNGESQDYLSMRQWPLSSGTMFTEQDVRSAAKVCIVGQTIVNNLFPQGDPVGQIIRIRNLPFKVLGVLAAKGFSVQGSDQDDLIVVPYTSAMKRITKQTYLRTINVEASSADQIDQIQHDITDLLRKFGSSKNRS